MTQTIKKVLIRNKKPLLLFLLGAVVVAVCLGGNFLSLVHNKQQMHKLTRQSKLLDKQYEELLRTQRLLEKQDPAYLEHLARTQYNMVKPYEIEFRFETN